TPAVEAQSARGNANAPSQRGRGVDGSRYVDAEVINYSDHAAWIRMFDSATLNGWDGPTDLWHVENGTIVVRSKADPPTGSTYLLWKGGEPTDFGSSLQVKLEGAGANSGVQCR